MTTAREELARLDDHIASLRKNFRGDEATRGTISALLALRADVAEAVADQAPKKGEPIELTDYSAASKKEDESSALVVLKATNEMLDKILSTLPTKEGQKPDTEIAIDALKNYLHDCEQVTKQATEWSVLQKLVAGVACAIMGLCFAALVASMPASSPLVLHAFLEFSKKVSTIEGASHTLHLFEKELKKELDLPVSADTTFFSPHGKSVSDIHKGVSGLKLKPSANEPENKGESEGQPPKPGNT